MPLTLGTAEVHVWWCCPDRIRDPHLLERQFATLSEDERQRQRRFVFERDRHQFLVSHAFVRNVLSRYAPVAAASWQFETNSHGRPYIVQPASELDLRFNLSHTEGATVVAVARSLEIGVDVENVRRGGSLLEIADRFFSPYEVAQLAHDPELFFDFWTLKEAYIKGRGLGLSIPLDGFSFDLADRQKPAISFHEGCPDDPAAWQFVLRRAGPDHRWALAVPLQRDRPMILKEHKNSTGSNVLDP